MELVVPSHLHPGSAWRRAFADTLIRLRPDLNPDVADELSDTAFLTHGDQKPEVSAQLFAHGAAGMMSIAGGPAARPSAVA